jgi:hypothetical protein
METKYGEIVDEKYFIPDFDTKIKEVILFFENKENDFFSANNHPKINLFVNEIIGESGLNFNQTLILTGVFIIQNSMKSSEGGDIFEFFNIKNEDKISFTHELKNLCAADYLVADSFKHIARLTERTNFYLAEDVQHQLWAESKLKKINYKFKNFAQFLDKIDLLIKNKYLNFGKNLSRLSRVFEQNSDLPELQWLDQFGMPGRDMLYFLCFLNLNREYLVDFTADDLSSLFDMDMIIDFVSDLNKGKSYLLIRGLIVPVFRTSLNDTGKYKLSDRAISYFGKRGVIANSYRPSKILNYMKYKDIQPKNLLFNKNLSVLNQELMFLMERKNFINYCNLCNKNKMRPNLSMFLFGPPGTGKTEWVMQMAKQTKRTIFHVNIGEIRGMFVGESEKHIVEIFKTYEEINKLEKHKGILLFNEADALIGNRIQVSDSVDQMNNSMQNILLEQLENFEGIFVATSNMPENLDPAFSRRFLYKIKVDKPDADTRLALLNLYFKDVEQSVLCQWAYQYQFTGAMLQNIQKKLIVKSFVSSSVNYPELLENLIKEEFVELKLQKPIKGFSI